MKRNRIYAMLFGVMLGIVAGLFVITMTASASLPSDVGDALGTDATGGGMVLATIFLVSTGLALAYMKANIILIIIAEVGVLGTLTIIGWVQGWMLLLVMMVFAGMFALRIASATTSYGKEE